MSSKDKKTTNSLQYKIISYNFKSPITYVRMKYNVLFKLFNNSTSLYLLNLLISTSQTMNFL